jgi:hypothetical protein
LFYNLWSPQATNVYGDIALTVSVFSFVLRLTRKRASFSSHQ